MTIGPEPKPIQTRATLHTVCITQGPLSTYKLFARVYGGKGDGDINVQNEHTATKLKMASLYDLMLRPFNQAQRLLCCHGLCLYGGCHVPSWSSRMGY
jgi:hypothetical protein